MNLRFNVIKGKGIKRTRLFWSFMARLLVRLRLSFRNFIVYFLSILTTFFLISQNISIEAYNFHFGFLIDTFESVHSKVNNFMAIIFTGSSLKELQKKLDQKGEDIQRLKEKIEILKGYGQENIELKKMLNISESYVEPFQTVKILGRPNGLMWSFLDVSRNSKNSFVVDLPVLMDRTIIGRIALVGVKSARVMLITSSYSKIPVKSNKINFQAILQGQNSPEMILTYLNASNENGDLSKEKIKEGDLLYTSGAGGVFPEGYPIARVDKIYQSDQNIKITAVPLIDLSNQKFIQIMNVSSNAVD